MKNQIALLCVVLMVATFAVASGTDENAKAIQPQTDTTRTYWSNRWKKKPSHPQPFPPAAPCQEPFTPCR